MARTFDRSETDPGKYVYIWWCNFKDDTTIGFWKVHLLLQTNKFKVTRKVTLEVSWVVTSWVVSSSLFGGHMWVVVLVEFSGPNSWIHSVVACGALLYTLKAMLNWIGWDSTPLPFMNSEIISCADLLTSSCKHLDNEGNTVAVIVVGVG